MVSHQSTRGPFVISVATVSIRLDDGRVISPTLQKRGELAALAISARYKFGDRLEVTCKSEGYDLELKKIRFLAPASPEELSKVMATLYWKKGENLLKTPPVPESPLTAAAASPESADIERIREVNLRTLEMMPGSSAHLHKRHLETTYIASRAALRFSRRPRHATTSTRIPVLSP